MTEETSTGGRSEAERLYASYQEREARGDAEAFGDFCGAHPEQARALDELRQQELRFRARVPRFGLGARLGQLGDDGRDLAALLEELRGSTPAKWPYVVQADLGKGTYGKVYEAREAVLGRRVALKVSRAGEKARSPGDSLRMLRRFVREARVLGRLAHPGIVALHGVGLDPDQRPYFAMRLVEGRDLSQVIQLAREGREGWTLYRVVEELVTVCEALAFAHEQGVVHRDVKPANIRVSKVGETYVMDWGLARIDEEPEGDGSTSPAPSPGSPDPERTDEGTAIGTVPYMSPEQARGQQAEVGPLSDVYAVGAILYHLLSGVAPYSEGGEPTVARVLQGPPRMIEELAPRTPSELLSITQRAMAPEPAERYASMRALAEDLRAFLEDRVVRAHRTGPWVELRKWVRRNRGLAAASFLAVAATLGGAVATSVVQAGKTRIEREQRLDLRLSLDASEVFYILAEEDSLWPAHPREIETMTRWQARLQEHASRLPEHRERLRRMESSPGIKEPEFPVKKEVQAQLVATLEALASRSHPRWRDIEGRLEFARSLEERSLTGPEVRSLWKEACAEIADREHFPKYGGLQLAPQLGLVPLGPDLDSMLWEFAHLQSGEPPVRDVEGRLVFRPESGLVFVLLPGGTSWIGSQPHSEQEPNYDPKAEEDETPNELTLRPFFFSKYEMTQAQWERLAGNNPAIYKDSLHPVEFVSWNDCDQLLGRMELVLPSEAQWEYACRAGTSTSWWTGPNPETLAEGANLCDQSCDGLGQPMETWKDGWQLHGPVHSLRPNPFGLHNTAGNVYEWCRDWFSDYLTDLPDLDGERKPRDQKYKIARGGCFMDNAFRLRSSDRGYNVPETKNAPLGVRPARRIDP